MDSNSRIAIIRNILNQYPLSIGIFREIIQNSEDAKASRQVFLLDCRVHPPAKLSGKSLKHTNGPALLAFNNATFRPEDWKGILSTYGSSKRMDISKIGKNGMGFRACFHITNYPQVFSKDTMVMLDPQGDFFDEGEARVTLEDIPIEIQESLNLGWFQEIQGEDPSPGTVIRLPLRTERHRHEISTKAISCQEVEEHFQSFIQAEIDICLLFLSSLKSVEFWMIKEGDVTPAQIALSDITLPSDAPSDDIVLLRRVETKLYPGASRGKDWLIRWYSVPDSISQSQLSARIAFDARSTMEKEKLTATVALAIQTGVFPGGCSTSGKLFTYLPLPSDTNYPFNIHAPFALTVDRQGLRNENEEGFVKGSDDHIRVEWNRYLFDTVIPVAWAKLLLNLSELSPSPFSAWPSTHRTPSGCSYWQDVPEKTVRWIINQNIPVWPVQGSSMPTTYNPYKDILIALPNTTVALLGAFVFLGLAITQPPQDVYNLLPVSQCHRLLTPELASATILELNPPIVDKDKRYILLDYLLSTGKVENIIDIPLLEQVDGSIIALSQKTETSSNHVILGEQDHQVFHQFAPHAISITRINLSSSITQLLQSTPLLNVEPLAADHILTYISQAPSHFGPFSGASSSTFIQYTSWISRFFEWLQCSPLENILCGQLYKYPLLPIHSGELKPVSSNIFSTNYTHTNNELVELLQRVGLSFLHTGVSATAQKYLDLKSLNNPYHVFTSLPPLLQPLSDPEIHTLQDYIVSHRWSIQKNPDILATLKKLPIYAHMVPSNPSLPQPNKYVASYLTKWSSIPNGVTFRVVAPGVTVLPMVLNTFFTPHSELSLVQVFDQALEITSNTDILHLAINHFQSQPQGLQAMFLELLSTVYIPSTSLSQLKSISFVLCADGKLHAPQGLVDPTDRLAKLLSPHSSHLPQYQTILEKRVVNSLKSLSLLPNTLTMEIFQEIVGIIIQKQDTKLSNLLLKFLNDNSTSWSMTSLLLNSPWLNTTNGLSSPANSHDHKYAELCNRVLPLLQGAKRIQSQKLLCALCWDTPPSLQIVVAQFKELVKEGKPSCSELLPVTSFLGSHLERLSRSGQLQKLEQFVKGKSWVPTYGSTLASTTFAIFKQDQFIPHFKQITLQFADNKDARSFLQAMGCMEKPSEDAISLILQGIENIPSEEIVAFLRAVNGKQLKAVLEGTGAHLPIVPTTDGLKLCSETHFNDIGPNAKEVPLPPGHSIASDHIDRKLALKLGLSFLSDLVGTLDDDEPMEMKEDLTTRISSVLLSYTKEQAFMEFLANAADARATEFGVTLATTQHQHSQFVSPSLEKLCSQPSLIFHNNGVFSPSDWKGICSVGSGNQEGKDDGKLRIGRFGLGSLSMFYFTEVAMILSGHDVLFMDPSKAYLGRGRSCYKISLEKMKKFFPAHLSLLDGYYGYKFSMDEYNGTLFKLHLRTEPQASQSTIYGTAFSRDDIKKLIIDFKRCAQDALFFIPIKKIKISYPSQHEYRPEVWTVEKSTVDLPGLSGVTKIHHIISPPKHWSVLFKTVPLQDIPSDFHKCLSIHKIQTVSVGIAGAVDTSPLHHRPFFGVPLLDTISLPVHLHCTFILSDDRRSIRYDEDGDGNLESKFNKWLLMQKVPSFYLQFLSGWKSACPMKECPWWPKKSTKDRISRIVVEAMGKILPTSGELVCDTYSGSRIAPSKAHFLQSSCPQGLLLALLPVPKDLAVFPSGFPSLPSVQEVDSDYLRAVLQSEADSIISMYKEGKVTVDDVVAVAKFLELSSLPNSLGLPLLPLADGSLALLSADHTTFYYPQQEHKTSQIPFPLHHFLDPQAAKKHTIYDSLQVHELDNAAISRLIMAKIPEQDVFSSPDLGQWFKELWDLLSAIPEVTIEDHVFQQLPLIPTYSPGTPTWISFQKLVGSEILVIESTNTNAPLDACVALGMRLIKAGDCRWKLREVIRSRKGEQSPATHHAIIRFFMDLSPNDVPRRFQGLNHNHHSKFSRWFRQQLGSDYHSLTYTERGIVQRLPLWEAIQVRVGRTPKFISAHDASVIPKGIDPEVVRMWAVGSTVYIRPDNLLLLLKDPLTPPIFYKDHLAFPPVMNTVTPTYKSLLTEVLRSQPSQRSILVPNTNGKMTLSSDLYISSNTTFTAAFALQTRVFLHRELRTLETQLRGWGLIDTLTASSFKACASAINQDINSVGILTRALTVFRSYNTEMPPELMRDRGSRNALQNLRFIPRRVGDIRYGSILTDRYCSLPKIVSPSETVDPKFARIVWTQRAICLEEPSSELRLVNSLDSVWEPTAREVIEHLCILATQIAPDLRYNSELIEDLKATYSWLADHENQAEEWLLDHNQDKLFFNVDNPVSEWRWNSASELLFDEKDSLNSRRVREFLKNYGGLLRAAGVQKVSHVSVPDDLLDEDPHEKQLKDIRDRFKELREGGHLTDVTFVAEDGAEFAAHRVFLAARSEYFKTEFTHGWRESMHLNERVKIDVDYSRECLEAVLDWIYVGRYDLQTEETERFWVLGEMYRLAHYWGFEDSDLFKGLTRELIGLIGTRTYEGLRKLAEDLCLEDGPLAKKCEEFERLNRSVLADGR